MDQISTPKKKPRYVRGATSAPRRIAASRGQKCAQKAMSANRPVAGSSLKLARLGMVGAHPIARPCRIDARPGTPDGHRFARHCRRYALQGLLGDHLVAKSCPVGAQKVISASRRSASPNQDPARLGTLGSAPIAKK